MIDLFQEIYGTIKRNKLRTALTGFAVAWGIFMLIVLLGAGNGLLNAFQSQGESMSMNSMQVWPGWAGKPYKGLKGGRSIKLTNNELATTQRMDAHILAAEGIMEQNNVYLSKGNESVSLTLKGVSPEHPQLEGIKLKTGRFVNEPDLEQCRKVIVLHEKTVEMLFGSKESEAVGAYIEASGLVYRIIGVYKDMGNNTPPAYVPVTTLQLIYNKQDELGSILFLTKNIRTEEESQEFEDEYRKVIGSLRQFDSNDRSAIWIWSRIQSYAQQQKGNDILRTAIWIIGIFTLLSGIVGVSNIMLITVKERTHEFGIRKAIGAKPASILRLIIVESIVITTLFGYIGLVAGIGVTEWMNAVAGEQVMDIGVAQATVFKNPTVDLHVALQATLTLVIAGTLAGLFPARKAALIRPIEALRAD
ncbi:MAG: ABC transporter permease [Bacteroidaceae bacterium]|nr:ABC transporter permease [Bacteroidaceae bacterium]MBQ8223901.1 ABC transporter permease [Bacteroides sp.]